MLNFLTYCKFLDIQLNCFIYVISVAHLEYGATLGKVTRALPDLTAGAILNCLPITIASLPEINPSK